jgi:hypothetical protein
LKDARALYAKEEEAAAEHYYYIKMMIVKVCQFKEKES